MIRYNMNKNSKPTFKIEKEDGIYIVISNSKNEIKYIIEPEKYFSNKPASGIGFMYNFDKNKNVDLIEVLEDNKIKFELLKITGHSIYFGEVKDNTFKTDITLLFYGHILGTF